ncbi:MAG: tyrosine-type recombinase/integrase [Solirubrobacteraceae bacterium]
MGDLSRIRVTGPLEPYVSGFVTELVERGYTPVSVAHQLRLMAHVSRWLASEGFGPDDLSSVRVEQFVAARRAAGYVNYVTVRALAALLEYLRGVGVVPPGGEPALSGVEELLGRYRAWLCSERGLAEVTVRNYADMVRPFVASRLNMAGELDLRSLSAADVLAFVLAQCPHRRPGSAKLLVTALRSLLGYLHVVGLIARPLAPVVPSVAGWRLAGLPRGLGAEQVTALLASCDRATAIGARDFAILKLLIRLGIRRGEVAALTLDDIDWRCGEIVVRGKGSRSERLPLPADVGDALADYLRRVRPASAEGRAVFVRVRAPHRALSAAGISQVVIAAGNRSGLGRVNAHRLRHTTATELLRSGAPLVEIGQLLRHRSQQTTAIYAKVDRERLRALARPWPSLGGVS